MDKLSNVFETMSKKIDFFSKKVSDVKKLKNREGDLLSYDETYILPYKKPGLFQILRQPSSFWKFKKKIASKTQDFSK